MSRDKAFAWRFFRFLVLAAAASLAVYIPFKYATQLHAIDGIYAFLFPLSSLVALAGLALAWKPALGLRIPLWLRAGTSVIAVGWIATGVLCIPSLTRTTMAAPLAGLFATFHMTAQHIFLSLSVTLLLLAPQAVHGWFRQPLPTPKKAVREKAAPSRP